ncbi:hypothetical protein HNR16_002934 [Pseudoclavibacter chungangensis]|nr:hypothetical protein [Pseudoclavibacter chungangensis]NYJ68146.1 hypothetical protein [Pseudoclavibacter chungangensis]
MHEGQRFCPECGTKLSAAAASADASNAVPHRPVGVGQGVQWNSPTPPHLASDPVEDERDPDELDDFFSSYRRKGPQPSPEAGEQPTEAPMRRSRRRFNPDLSYGDGPLPAAPRPAHPTGGVPVTPPAAASEWAPPEEPAASGPPADVPNPPSRAEHEPEPVSAPTGTESSMPSWFEELPGDEGRDDSAHAAPDPFAAASERGSWDNFSSVTGELDRDDAPAGEHSTHRAQATPGDADARPVPPQPGGPTRPPAAHPAPSWQDDDIPPTQMHPVASSWQDDDVPATQVHPASSSWQDDDIPATQVHGVVRRDGDDGPLPESWFGESDDAAPQAARPESAAPPRQQAPRQQAPRGAVPPAPEAAGAAGQGGGSAPRSFDELLTGAGPGGPVVDDEQPISSRDFDQTGIVQMPQHPQARPSGAPSIFEAPGVAGRPADDRRVGEAGTPDRRQAAGTPPPSRPEAGAPAAFTPPPTFSPTANEPAPRGIDAPPFANEPTSQPTFGQSPAAHREPADQRPDDASFARPGATPEWPTSPAQGAPERRAPEHREPEHRAPEHAAVDDPFAPPADPGHTAAHGAPFHAAPEHAAPEHDAWEPEPPTAGYGTADDAAHGAPAHRAPEHRAPEHAAPPTGRPPVDENEARELESWFGAEPATTRFDAAPSIEEANRGPRGAQAPDARAQQGADGNAGGADLLGAWFGGEDEPDDERDDVRADSARPWYEQGIDGTESPSARVAHAGAAPAAAPEWAAPQGGGTVEPGAEYVAHGARPAQRAAQSAGAGPAGRGGAGDRGPRAGGPGGGSGGAGGSGGSRLDRTGRRRLWTIAIAVVGSILLIVSAVIIGNQMRGGQSDVAESPEQSEQASPEEQQAEPEQTEAAPPEQPPAAVADPNFEFTSFQSESANLRCVVSPTYGVACQHSNPAFTVPDTVCADSSASGAVVGLDSNGYTFPCLTQDIPYGQPTLAMNTPTQVGEFTCTITLATGVTCTNAAGDSMALEFEQGITTAGRASTSPQQPESPLPPA